MASWPMNAKVPMPRLNINKGRWSANLNSPQVNVFCSISATWALESPTRNCRPTVVNAVIRVRRSGNKTICRFLANSMLFRPSSLNITRNVAENDAHPRSGSCSSWPCAEVPRPVLRGVPSATSSQSRETIVAPGTVIPPQIPRWFRWFFRLAQHPRLNGQQVE